MPRPGRLAVAREPGACHNDLHGTNRTRCIIATFMYGTRRAWAAFVPLYARRVRELMIMRAQGGGHGGGGALRGEGGAGAVAAPKAVCTEQDVFEDVASEAPHLFDEFDVGDPWGWTNPRPHDPNTPLRGRRGNGRRLLSRSL